MNPIETHSLTKRYGETTVEREREEHGSEVVITIQERETLTCGNTRMSRRTRR